jgi:hypothetical protein
MIKDLKKMKKSLSPEITKTKFIVLWAMDNLPFSDQGPIQHAESHATPGPPMGTATSGSQGSLHV